MSTRETVRERFGGSWDGPATQLHGLIETAEGPIKLDVVARGDSYVCSVFSSGACLATARAKSAVVAVGDALDQVTFYELSDDVL